MRRLLLRPAPAAASDGPTILTTGDPMTQSVDAILHVETLVRDGESIVRQSDGIHLSIPGARIAAGLVLTRPRDTGIL